MCSVRECKVMLLLLAQELKPMGNRTKYQTLFRIIKEIVMRLSY